MYATEAAPRIIDGAVQRWGGLGVTVGQTVERLYREIRTLRIYEGTTEINKLVIAGQTYTAFAAEPSGGLPRPAAAADVHLPAPGARPTP